MWFCENVWYRSYEAGPGLQVKPVLDTHDSESGQEVSSEEMQGLRLRGHAFHPEWNYTLLPRGSQRQPRSRRSARRVTAYRKAKLQTLFLRNP